ncbi:MAG TPA: hypothetical protein VLQ52_00365 [Coriobacteriia bacterium]|nr:hypothetical protein [Coriobacteriia bacterium]
MWVHAITVLPETIDVEIAVDDASVWSTAEAPHIVPALLEVLPGLAAHVCGSCHGAQFSEELADTELPHLFEHVTLELMALAGSPRDLWAGAGWQRPRSGASRVRLSFEDDDDLVCLGAINLAQQLIEAACDGGALPDVAGETARLRSLRSRPPAMPASD